MSRLKELYFELNSKGGRKNIDPDGNASLAGFEAFLKTTDDEDFGDDVFDLLYEIIYEPTREKVLKKFYFKKLEAIEDFINDSPDFLAIIYLIYFIVGKDDKIEALIEDKTSSNYVLNGIALEFLAISGHTGNQSNKQTQLDEFCKLYAFIIKGINFDYEKNRISDVQTHLKLADALQGLESFTAKGLKFRLKQIAKEKYND